MRVSRPFVLKRWTPARLGRGLFLEASDISTMFQSGAAATDMCVDGGVCGSVLDKSGNNFHLTSVADDTTRPSWNYNAGLPYLGFDGSNDLLRRDSNLGMYSGGPFSAFIAARSATPGTSATLVTEGASASGNQFVNIFRANNGTATTQSENFRDDGGVNVAVNTITVANAWNDADRVVGLTDDGNGGLISYLSSTTVADTGSYTRGTITCNRFGLGANYRSTTANWFPGRVYGLSIVLGRVITLGERASVISYLGAKMGLSL